MLFLSFFIIAQTVSYDLENGKKKYASCVSCHKSDATGNPSQKSPRLVPQYSWYIIKQIKDIKEGKRTGGEVHKMMPFVKNLTDKDIEDIAHYLESINFSAKK